MRCQEDLRKKYQKIELLQAENYRSAVYYAKIWVKKVGDYIRQKRRKHRVDDKARYTV